MLKIDLHTHSVGSYDGGLSLDDYKQVIERGKADVIAITDHGTIDVAKQYAKDRALRHSLIIGQEVRTTRGEIIGLFLKKPITDGQTPLETVQAIR